METSCCMCRSQKSRDRDIRARAKTRSSVDDAAESSDSERYWLLVEYYCLPCF